MKIFAGNPMGMVAVLACAAALAGGGTLSAYRSIARVEARVTRTSDASEIDVFRWDGCHDSPDGFIRQQHRSYSKQT
jgi:hypothetical protein